MINSEFKAAGETLHGKDGYLKKVRFEQLYTRPKNPSSKQRRKFFRREKLQAWRRKRKTIGKNKANNNVGGITWQMGDVTYKTTSSSRTAISNKPSPDINSINGLSINIVSFKRKVSLKSALGPN